MERAKILIIGSFPKKNKKVFGGINKSCNILINSVEFKKYDILTIDSSLLNKPIPNILIRIKLASKRCIKFFYYLIFNKPKIILIFCSDGLSAIEKGLMIRISKLFNIPSMIFPRAGNLIKQVKESKIFHFTIKNLFNSSSIFLSQGENWSKFAQHDLLIAKEDIVQISNWSATKDLIEIGKKRKIKDRGVLQILFVGWLEKEKGVVEILNSILELNQNGFKFKMFFIGDGSLMRFAMNFITKNELNDVVFLEGWKNFDELKEFYNLSDIFILPSWKEGMPNSLIEAIATGLPSIVSNVGVIPNHLKDNFDTLLIKPKDQLALSNAIKSMLTDVSLRKKISKNALMTAKSVFLESKSLTKLTKTIDNLI